MMFCRVLQRVPGAAQHGAKRNDAPQTRDRSKGGVWNGPGSAVHHSRFALALHCIRDTRGCLMLGFLLDEAGQRLTDKS
jgi:hypothetical protein